MCCALFIITLLIAGATDAAAKKIYNLFPLVIIAVSIWKLMQNPDARLPGIIGFFALSVPMLLIALRRGGLGGGDIKLTAACGLFLGADALLAGAFAACLLALAAYVLRRLRERLRQSASSRERLPEAQPRRTAFAFGPYLAAGYILAALVF